MNTELPPTSTPTTHSETHPNQPFWRGRGSLVIAGFVYALAIYLTIGLITMEVPESAEAPGPKFYPIILTIGAYLLGTLLTLDTWRHPQPRNPPDTASSEPETSSAPPMDPKAVIVSIAAFLVFALVLQPLGWILSAALLFWVMSLALGAPRRLQSLGIGLALSSAIQIAFSMGLGLTLPAGILGGIF